MKKQTTQSFKWLPLAAVGMLFPSAYIWIFLWCLKLNVNFWVIYIVLYGGAIASSFLPTSRKAQSKRAPLVKEFTRSRPQPS
ncbi:hypothetical protein [Fischerella sp. JS2]|jgi:hypothetical protein|uniref:hypothetical protein n=1 Tax=Fischerella sp. JS2 TaxID=2597771 RepID=UPI000C7FFB3A|nr:hypothetical protein [Fischerella sp. JS2]PMB51177.1 hypothetical protein CEN39_16595 [Fischerella thermalis CCMEE 5201]